jgi:hypothetical protein
MGSGERETARITENRRQHLLVETIPLKPTGGGCKMPAGMTVMPSENFQKICRTKDTQISRVNQEI